MRLRAENAILRERLARYEGDTPTPTLQTVAHAVAEAYSAADNVSSTDWIASWWVLTTCAGAPRSFAAFAVWAQSLHVDGMPPCKADLLRKADPIFLKPPYRWGECTTVRVSVLQRRLQVAQRLKQLLGL